MMLRRATSAFGDPMYNVCKVGAVRTSASLDEKSVHAE
jgi:hypothetical protein